MMQQDLKPQPARRLSYFHDALSLHTVDFPIFYIESISERHVVIAGGGGSSKTGVHNQINILELSPTNGSCYATLVAKYKEIPDAIMSGSLMKDLPIARTRLVTAGSHPAIYQLSFDSTKNFNIAKHDILTDSRTRSEVKCVKYAAGKIFAGGIDGQLSVWDDREVISETKAHTKEIDEIDFDTINEHVVTLSRGQGCFIVWNLDDLKPVKEVTNKDFTKSLGVTYCLRSCKYALESNNKSKVPSLMVACNPIPAKNQSCLLSKMSAKGDNKLTVIGNKLVNVDGIMAMAVSMDGKLVAVGSRSGGVSVFKVKNLSQIYNINNAHHNAVTDLTFLPPTLESKSLTDSNLCPLLSVSIDRRVIIHRSKIQSVVVKWFKYFLIMIVIYLIFFVISKHALN